MEQSTIAIIIIVITVISFILEKIPLALTSALAALAMGAFNIIQIKDVYGSFGSQLAILVASVMIIASAMFENGVAQSIGDKMLKLGANKSERIFVTVVVAFAAVMSAFASNSATIAMCIPLIGAAAAKSNGKIQNKNAIMAAGMAAGAGGFCTLIGSTPQLLAQGIFEQTEGLRPMTFFELAYVGVPMVIVMVIYFATVGYNIQKKVLDFDDVRPDADTPANLNAVPKWKFRFTSIVAVASLVGFISGVWDIAMVALAGATLLLVFKCIGFKKAFSSMDWNTVILLGTSPAFAKGLETSGGGKLIAETVLNLFGSSASPAVVLSVVMLVTVVLTNFMANTAVVAMMVPIAVNIAFGLNANAMSFGIAIVIAGQVAFATPVGTGCVTQTLVGGYRFNDYVKVGLPVTILMTIVCIVLVPIVYGL